MKALTRAAIACALAAASTAPLAMESAACQRDPGARGIVERVANMREQMNRIEWSAYDPVQQRRLMDLHMKSLNEGLQEMRRRAVSLECRMDVMQAMMEQIARHQLAYQEAED